MSVATPVGYECDAEVVANAQADAKETGAQIAVFNDPVEAMKDADVVCTDTWTSMGQEAEKAERVKIFQSYQVNKELFNHAKDDAIFIHCLPAYRGYEVTEDIIDGPMSVVFDEAENRLHAQKAILVALMAD